MCHPGLGFMAVALWYFPIWTKPIILDCQKCAFDSSSIAILSSQLIYTYINGRDRREPPPPQNQQQQNSFRQMNQATRPIYRYGWAELPSHMDWLLLDKLYNQQTTIQENPQIRTRDSSNSDGHYGASTSQYYSPVQLSNTHQSVSLALSNQEIGKEKEEDKVFPLYSWPRAVLGSVKERLTRKQW